MTGQIVLDEQLAPQLVDSPPTRPLEAGEARVRIARAGINFWEIMQRRGRVPVPDHRVPGTEGAGVVEEVGAAVTGLAPGQRVTRARQLPGGAGRARRRPDRRA